MYLGSREEPRSFPLSRGKSLLNSSRQSLTFLLGSGRMNSCHVIREGGPVPSGGAGPVVDDDLLPLNPGLTFTLTYSDTYYWPTHSRFYENLAPGTPVYAQVDAWGDASTGGVLENHEILGEAYNNISMTTSADRSGRDHAAIPTYSLRPWLENMLP